MASEGRRVCESVNPLTVGCRAPFPTGKYVERHLGRLRRQAPPSPVIGEGVR